MLNNNLQMNLRTEAEGKVASVHIFIIIIIIIIILLLHLLLLLLIIILFLWKPSVLSLTLWLEKWNRMEYLSEVNVRLHIKGYQINRFYDYSAYITKYIMRKWYLKIDNSLALFTLNVSVTNIQINPKAVNFLQRKESLTERSLPLAGKYEECKLTVSLIL